MTDQSPDAGPVPGSSTEPVATAIGRAQRELVLAHVGARARVDARGRLGGVCSAHAQQLPERHHRHARARRHHPRGASRSAAPRVARFAEARHQPDGAHGVAADERLGRPGPHPAQGIAAAVDDGRAGGAVLSAARAGEGDPGDLHRRVQRARSSTAIASPWPRSSTT